MDNNIFQGIARVGIMPTSAVLSLEKTLNKTTQIE
jgi:hypothetical protein